MADPDMPTAADLQGTSPCLVRWTAHVVRHITEFRRSQQQLHTLVSQWDEKVERLVEQQDRKMERMLEQRDVALGQVAAKVDRVMGLLESLVQAQAAKEAPPLAALPGEVDALRDSVRLLQESERRRAAALDTRLASLSDGVNGIRADVVELYNAHLEFWLLDPRPAAQGGGGPSPCGGAAGSRGSMDDVLARFPDYGPQLDGSLLKDLQHSCSAGSSVPASSVGSLSQSASRHSAGPAAAVPRNPPVTSGRSPSEPLPPPPPYPSAATDWRSAPLPWEAPERAHPPRSTSEHASSSATAPHAHSHAGQAPGLRSSPRGETPPPHGPSAPQDRDRNRDPDWPDHRLSPSSPSAFMSTLTRTPPTPMFAPLPHHVPPVIHGPPCQTPDPRPPAPRTRPRHRDRPTHPADYQDGLSSYHGRMSPPSDFGNQTQQLIHRSYELFGSSGQPPDTRHPHPSSSSSSSRVPAHTLSAGYPPP